jgi:hypothetical protein
LVGVAVVRETSPPPSEQPNKRIADNPTKTSNNGIRFLIKQ